MDTIYSTNRNFNRVLLNILSIIVILALAFPVTGSASAQEPALPEGWHDGVEGSVNAASCSASGWAVDPDNRDRDLQVQILADGSPVATTTADLLREDVGACTGGTCGFGVSLWGLISAGEEHQITTQAYDEETSTWVDLSGTPKPITCWGYPEGFHDGVEGMVESNSCGAFGWAADPDDRDRDLQVQVLADGSPVATTTADLLREDVGACTGGTCGFGVELWGLISPDVEHQITVQAFDEETNAWLNLEATPKSLTCQAPPLPSPWLVAFPENDAVQGWEWPEHAIVYLTIDNAPGLEWKGTAEVTSWGDPRTYLHIEFGDDYNLQVGDEVTLTDEFGTTRTHLVQNLEVTEVNGDTDTVSGTAHVGAIVQVWPHGTDYFIEDTVEDGTWTADFGALGFHTIEETGGRSQIVVDGNATAVDWNAPPPPPSPWLTVRANDDRVEAFDWEIGTTLTLEIDDPGIDGAPDYSTTGVVTGPTPWGDPRNYLSFNLAGVFDILPGFEVSVGDGTLTKTLSVTNLTITDIDLDGNVVYGQAAEGMRVDIWPCDNVMCANRHVNAESSSSWAVDFDVPGTEPHEQTTFDIKGGIVIDSGQCDEDGDCTNFSVAIPNPRMVVFPEWEWFDGLDWPDGATVSISVAGKSVCDTSKVSWEGFFNGNFNNFDNGCNVEVGDVVTFTDDITTRTHTVRNLAVTAVDELSNTVSGMSDPYETVYVWQHEPGPQIPFESNENGEWLADLNGVYDIRPGSGGRSEIRDQNGNATAVDWYVPNPFIAVSLTEHWFWVNNFKPETLVTFSIYENQGDESPILEFSKPTDGSGNLTIEGWEHIWDPEPGDYIVATDGTNTKGLVLEYITLDVFDPVNDLVSGHAMPGREIGVGVGNQTGEQWMNVFADDQTGLWIADFTLEGFEFDITEHSWAGGHVNDEDGDVTAAHNSGPPEPPARFTAFPEQDAVEAWDFPLGAIVHLAIDDPATEGSPDFEQDETVMFAPWGSWQLWVWFDFAGMYDMKAGDVVTLSYRDVVRTHTVQNLAITKVNQEDDIVKGTADAGVEIHVWPHATGQEQLVITNPKGKWNVDFTGTYDLMPGDAGRAEIRDEVGNATAVDWYIPKPRIVASITEDWFYLLEFNPNTMLDFTVYSAQGGKPIWKGTVTTDGSGFAWIDAEGRWDLEPGKYLVVKEGGITKDLIIEGFTFDFFNLANGQLVGTTPDPYRHVWVGIGLENDTWTMDVNSDLNGNWSAYFGNSVPSDYGWVAAQIFDADGDASELRPSAILDWTLVIANQPDWVDSGITVSAGQSFTIETLGLMNPCSDTYPNGADYCIFFSPLGAEGVVPDENEFGIFPGPGLRFMALLGRIGDGAPFYVGAGGTFTAEQSGTLWFTPNDNLRTDNQGAYGVMVRLEPQE